ncbi:hypothetical protein RJ639_029943, partial [Escallonia herrerae]
TSSGRKKKGKGKVKWSKLYTFSCLRASFDSDQQLLGQPGFSRVVFCNESQLHHLKPHKYPSNYISTTKYNVATFLPKALFEQFRRVANLYFLFAAVLSLTLTSLAPFSPASMVAPLVFVVGISMLKEALEDWHRFLQDLNVNSRKVKVHTANGLFVEKAWKALCVGDVVKINKNEYFPSDLLLLSSSYEDGFLQFVRALILYGYLIPISLYVSIELVKVLQAMLINKDLQMYDEISSKFVEARTSNLNEELGQVEMILSDKTGTLTCNQMEFRKCSIEGISYGGDMNEVDIAASKRMNIDVERYRFSLDGSDSTGRSLEMFEFSAADHASTEKDVLGHEQGAENLGTNDSRIPAFRKESMIKGFNFRDDQQLNKLWIYRSNVSDMVMFFRVMALCHTGIPVDDDDQTVMVLSELDPSSGLEVERKYKLLNLLEFSSSRKRMSVIVSDENGQIFLLCKGADNIVFDRLADNGRTYQQATTMHLSSYAEDGLRTLVFGYRKVEVNVYERWNSTFTKAKATMGPQREEELENAAAIIEKELILLGAVAVDDKLQDGVPECIDRLAQAGLKIWLLTGDKMETAVNIGYACSLLRHDMKQLHLSLSKEAETSNQVKVMKEDILHQIQSSYDMTIEEKNKEAPFALVVDGKALEIALRSDTRDQFLQLAVSCASVICCRVSPKQKAFITRSVKQHTGKTTLAIGDGANDVGMIQEADIGVGISGMEGMQAVMASDFSLPQFHFLERLLIVHGQWCYKRLSKMVKLLVHILYFVYKNVAFGLTLFYYEVYTAFSSEVLYDDWYMVMFNVCLTSLPVISLGVLEQDVSPDLCLQVLTNAAFIFLSLEKFPALYQQGQKNIYFSWKRIIGWILNGILASLAIFLANIYILSPTAFRGDGEVADLAHIGAITYTCIIWTVNCQIALIIMHFTWIQHCFIWGSILCWYMLLFLFGTLPPKYSSEEFQLFTEAIGPAPMYWIATLLVVAIALLPYLIITVIQKSLYPLDDHVIQEMKGSRTDIRDNPLWLREQENFKKITQVGFSARVDATIQNRREKLYKKKKSMFRSMTNSPIYKTVTGSPLFS